MRHWTCANLGAAVCRSQIPPFRVSARLDRLPHIARIQPGAVAAVAEVRKSASFCWPPVSLLLAFPTVNPFFYDSAPTDDNGYFCRHSSILSPPKLGYCTSKIFIQPSTCTRLVLGAIDGCR